MSASDGDSSEPSSPLPAILKSSPVAGRVGVHVYIGDEIDGVARILDITSQPDNESQTRSERKGKRRTQSSIESFADDSDEEFGPVQAVSVNYFMGHASRTKTSGKTLKDVDLSALQDKRADGLINYLESDKARAQLVEKNEKQFAEMFHLLYESATVITYGFGSKKLLLEAFAAKWLVDEYHLVISGFFPEITIKHVMANLKEAMEADGADEESLIIAAEELEFDLYVVIHSLDVLLTTTSAKLKPFLINLVQKAAGKLHLIASVDHVHSGLLFNSKQVSQLNLVWFSCPTMEAYSLERGYASRIDSNSSSAMVTLSSIEHVYESLNPNAQKIFLLILNHTLHKGIEPDLATEQLQDESEESDFGKYEEEEEVQRRPKKKGKNVKNRTRLRDIESEGLPFSTLYRICREEYLVNSEITLKAQLTEFKDHKVIRFNKRSDGTQTINLLINVKLAQKFVERVEESA